MYQPNPGDVPQGRAPIFWLSSTSPATTTVPGAPIAVVPQENPNGPDVRGDLLKFVYKNPVIGGNPEGFEIKLRMKIRNTFEAGPNAVIHDGVFIRFA